MRPSNMITLIVDFNAPATGLVRGRAAQGIAEDALDEALAMGCLVLLRDNEGSEAVGKLRELRDNLVFAEVDWETFGPEGRIEFVDVAMPEARKATLAVTGEGVEPRENAADPVPATVHGVETLIAV
jgi:hypothetical protein